MFLEKTRWSEKTNKSSQVNSPKLIVMSATLNHKKFSEFLCGCPVFEIPGRCFPVKSVYLDHIGVKDLQTPNYLKRVSSDPYLLLVVTFFVWYVVGTQEGSSISNFCRDQIMHNSSNHNRPVTVATGQIQ